MPERSFGRTVRYRRTKLGLSQAKLGELVGRSPATIRAWERDSSHPNDPKVLAALAAILAIDERMLFEKAGLSLPEVETSPTVEQALASLDSNATPDVDAEPVIPDEEVIEEEHVTEDPVEPMPELAPDDHLPREPVTALRRRTPQQPSPNIAAFRMPPDPLPITRLTPNVNELSYIEDRSQRQLYRVRNLATLVVAVALVIAFIWAFGEGWGALGDWWDEFFGNLRL